MTTQQQIDQAVSPELYKNIMGQFPTGVTVITAYNDLGDVVGFTASAFSALSMDPALVLVCQATALTHIRLFVILKNLLFIYWLMISRTLLISLPRRVLINQQG